MNQIQNGWFSEISTMWPGQAQSLEVKEVLWDKKSDFQDVLVFESKACGTVFCLDGAIQVTDLDECSYHENMAHIPCFAHREGPKDVLIIGGGDGGVMREVLRHPSVQTVTLCDIDGMVTEISRKFYPHLACSFEDPRAKLIVGDGFKFMEDKVDAFDVVIIDSSDPEGPASVLFGKEFYERCRRALRKGGILVAQGESIWLHLDLIKSMMDFTHNIGFKYVEYALIQMPTYPDGSIGFIICSDDTSSKVPSRPVTDEFTAPLRYYSDEMHRAAFSLPLFVKRRLAEPPAADTAAASH